MNNVRYRHRRLRAKLQSKGTKSARRRLKKLAGKERRFAANTNHTISKRIVTAARHRTRDSLEDLSGIRERVTVRRAQRATLHSWSFFQLRSFVEYKAQLVGVPVVAVGPAGYYLAHLPNLRAIDKRNRPSQGTFSCVACGYSGLADHIAAVNISRRAAVNPPYVSDAPSAA